MKQLLLLPLVGLFSLLTIASRPAAPSLSTNKADPVTSVYRDFEETFSLCNGEIVYMKGTMVLTRHISPGVRNQTARYSLHYLGVTGISETGVSYKMIGQETILFRTYSWGDTYAIAGMRTMRFIAEGSGMELMITDMHHIAVFPDGSFNFVVDSRFIHCNTEHLIIRQNH